MGSPTTVKNFKYNSSQQPILNVIETPLKYRSFAHSDNQIDLSFSSYLKQENPENSAQDVHGIADYSEINVFDAQKYFSESNDPKESKELLSPSSLKHIAEPIDSVSRLSSVSSADEYNRNFRVRSFRATPTASSEASWNSQTGLLSNPPGSIPVSLRNPSADQDKKRSGSSAAKWLFCRKCPCVGRKSLQVVEGSSEHKTAPSVRTENHSSKASPHKKNRSQRNPERVAESVSNMSQKSSATVELPHRNQKVAPNPAKIQTENYFIMPNSVLQRRVSAPARPFSDNADLVGGFSFPILNTSSQTAAPGSNSRPKPNINNPLEEPPRESLEVFQPPDTSNLRKSVEDDVGSDASSDLFEIESFSTQTSNYPIYCRRDSLDDATTINARRLAASSIAPEAVYGRRSSLDEPMTPTTECYAPSEASIDWSVTTAEGFDKASMTNFSITASEIEEFTTLRGRSSLEKTGEEDQAWNSNIHGNGGNEGGKTKLGNGFLSCRHEKAVNVGPHPIKCLHDGQPLPLQLISTSGHVRTANRPPKPSVPPASARCHSARLSLAFAA